MVTQDYINDIKIGTNVIDGDEYKDTLEAVSEITCNIVAKTLGPYASTTVIDDGGSTYSTKDGWSVVNRLRFSDPIENILFSFIKDISFALNSKVGDGTTTAIVAANKFISIFREWMDKTRSDKNSPFHGIRQADLLDAINDTANAIIDELQSEKRVKRIQTADDIYKIAYISTNGNEVISNMIKEIYEATQNPNIHVTLNTGGETRYEIENGYKLDAKLLNPSCHFNTSEETCEFNEEAKVVIFDHNVTYVKHYKLVQSLINSVCNQEKPQPLIIMAPFYDEIFSSLMASTIRKITNAGQISPVILVQIPASTLTQKCYLNDFAILCEAQIFDSPKLELYTRWNKVLSGEIDEDEDAAKIFNDLKESSEFESPEDILACSIGKARKLTIGKNFILLEKFRKDTAMYLNTLDHITNEYNEAKRNADANNNRMNMAYSDAHMRLIKFTGQTGTIFVGGDSELSCKCLKDAVDDAVLACRSAYEYGYIRGLNLETLSAIQDLSQALDENESLKRECLNMYYLVFKGISLDVMYNKYINDDIDKEEFLDSAIWKWDDERILPDEVITRCISNNTLEYNIVTEKYGPAGSSVVNSVSTDIEIIRATTSMLSLLLSSNQLISVNRQFDRKKGLEDAEKKERHRYENITEGVVAVLNKSLRPFKIQST